MPNMHIIYRIADAGNKKEKPSYINNAVCLRNALAVFPPAEFAWTIIADNVGSDTRALLASTTPPESVKFVSVGHGSGTFNMALDLALDLAPNEVVYFLENDYLHRPGSGPIIQEGLSLNADYVTLYLHPDKFMAPGRGGNPNVEHDGGYRTRIYAGPTELFGVFDSTTMTFAARVKTLTDDERTIRKFARKDFKLFTRLGKQGRILVCPLNTYSTHGETAWLAPFVDWQKLSEPFVA